MQTLTVILSTVSFVLSIISGVIGFFALVELKSFMRSTHKVEFIPLDAGIIAKKEPHVDEELKRYGLAE
jgi:cytochrome c oxidase subunit IV